MAITNGSVLSLIGATYFGGGDGFNLTLDSTSSIELYDVTLDGYNGTSVRSEFAYHSLILSVSGDISQNTQGQKHVGTEEVDGAAFYLYKCFINSVQMADNITATLH